jgi:zinc transport system permease protein
MFEIFQYDFIIRGLESGIIIAFIAPLIGIFLVLRRYSLIADTLSHISLAGVAIAFLFGWNPVLTTIGVTTLSSVGIEKLRNTKNIYGESALALFLSGGVALATILLSIGKGFSSNLFNYLFGSIVTVTQNDIITISILGIIIVFLLIIFYKELIYITFDEESAKVSGLPFRFINTLFIRLVALTVSLAIPIIGILLITALIVIPVVTALQLRKSFKKTILYSEIISIFSVIFGIFISYYFNLSTGGTIVFLMLGIFLLILLTKQKVKSKK